MSKAKIEGTVDAWESGELGQDEKFVKVSNTNLDELDGTLGLQMISIRMQKQLLDDLKSIATFHGLGYQPLMKQILRRFADSEMKRIARECMSGKAENVKLDVSDDDQEEMRACG